MSTTPEICATLHKPNTPLQPPPLSELKPTVNDYHFHPTINLNSETESGANKKDKDFEKPTSKMNTTPEMRASDHEFNEPPPPPPPPSPELKPTTANGEDRHVYSTNNPTSYQESENAKDDESSSCSPSYSSSDSGSDSDFFQINPPELTYPPPSSTTPVNQNTNNIEKIPNPNREKSPASGIERRSPVIQTMARDPNRIPSSIFARGPMTPMEWSVASNESLFSIHMGNTSFSRDQMFLNDRSGELRGFAGGMNEYPSAWIPPDLRAGGVGRRETGDLVVEIDEAAAASANAEAMKEVMRAAAEGKESEKKVMLGRSLSRHSDGSTTSFAFPILTGDGRIGSIKVNFDHHKDHQTNPQIRPSKMLSDKVPTARMRSHHGAHSQARAPVQSRWFPCFSSCKFRCCWDY
ncbi:uncharacterized protein LOC110029143 [Phalaenopsis equestris]|uniref:uncharacterized protein LOC110029143 n=1 Tax=Phalaenopsis equestris TaxID=78828 RepID=UPI0009E349B8|nr:uncharacterized protein LOC110029143 [Phalaenopsis equestris]XP_020586956.1 uncharacterized protein LOC110029143 [Phalaenopsis equestris]